MESLEVKTIFENLSKNFETPIEESSYKVKVFKLRLFDREIDLIDQEDTLWKFIINKKKLAKKIARSLSPSKNIRISFSIGGTRRKHGDWGFYTHIEESAPKKLTSTRVERFDAFYVDVMFEVWKMLAGLCHSIVFLDMKIEVSEN